MKTKEQKIKEAVDSTEERISMRKGEFGALCQLAYFIKTNVSEIKLSNKYSDERLKVLLNDLVEKYNY